MTYDLKQIIRILRGTGVLKVIAEYSGGGDEGHVNDVRLEVEEGSDGEKLDPPELFLRAGLGCDLDDLGEYLVEKYATGDYANNEGGYGTVTLDVMVGSVENEQYDYVQESVLDEINSGATQLVEPADGFAAVGEVDETVDLDVEEGEEAEVE